MLLASQLASDSGAAGTLPLRMPKYSSSFTTLVTLGTLALALAPDPGHCVAGVVVPKVLFRKLLTSATTIAVSFGNSNNE